jgi:hypothetical protein
LPKKQASVMVEAWNPSNLGGKSRRRMVWDLPRQNSETLSENSLKSQRTEGVAQVAEHRSRKGTSLEFKHQQYKRGGRDVIFIEKY